MPKFHINSKGDVKPCNATVKACRFGGDEQHFKDASEARAFVEITIANEGNSNILKGTKAFFRATALETNAKGFLTPESAKQITTKGVNCSVCDTPVPNDAMIKILTQYAAECRSCGSGFDLSPDCDSPSNNVFSVKIVIDEDNYSHKFYNKAAVYEETWSHTTFDNDWGEALKSDFEAHVGTEHAAFDRALTTLDSNRSSGGNLYGGFFMYKVKINKNASISDEVADDENSQTMLDESTDVARYVNRWEDSASISLTVKPEMIDIVDKQWIPVEEAFKYPTIYNIDYNEHLKL